MAHRPDNERNGKKSQARTLGRDTRSTRPSTSISPPFPPPPSPASLRTRRPLVSYEATPILRRSASGTERVRYSDARCLEERSSPFFSLSVPLSLEGQMGESERGSPLEPSQRRSAVDAKYAQTTASPSAENAGDETTRVTGRSAKLFASPDLPLAAPIPYCVEYCVKYVLLRRGLFAGARGYAHRLRGRPGGIARRVSAEKTALSASAVSAGRPFCVS